jgi:D-methionine transport system substrate-binding protein
MNCRHPIPRILLAAALALGFVGGAASAADLQIIRIGVTPGPHAQILEAVKPIAAKAGLDLKIIEFTDYVVPNEALNAGELDANSFQNQPYLDNQKHDRGYDIVGVGLTVNFPLGIYSRKHRSWAEVPARATIAIQNDPTNGGRSLLLLQDKGAIKLKPGTGFKPTVADITENTLALQFVEVDAAQTPRTLDDVDAAAINTNYAVEAGLKPDDAILHEDPKGPYVNLIAVRGKDKDAPWVKTLVDAYRSPEVKAFLEAKFKGAVLASW